VNRIAFRFVFDLDKLIGTTALTKYYCQYRKDVALLRMINFTQTSTKQVENKTSMLALILLTIDTN
jgi:hypothetical protein